MTKYLLKKILRKYRENIIISQSNSKINDINTIDFEHLTSISDSDKAQEVTCLEQIEMLTTMCQIYSKQQQNKKLKQIEQKIIYLLGYEFKS